MWSVIQTVICAGILGFISGVALACGSDIRDVLFPFLGRFRAALKRGSYWELVRMSNMIDAEMEERSTARMIARMNSGTHLNTENCFCVERNEIEDGPG